MSQITDYYHQAELSLAAYANLTMGAPSEPALIEAGMPIAQATDLIIGDRPRFPTQNNQ